MSKVTLIHTVVREDKTSTSWFNYSGRDYGIEEGHGGRLRVINGRGEPISLEEARTMRKCLAQGLEECRESA